MATFDDHANFGYSTVATAPSTATAGTSLVVQSGDGAKFPTPPFNAVIWPAGQQPTTSNSEIVRVTGKSTDTFTIARQTESSASRSVVVGDQIAAAVTDKTLTDIENRVLVAGADFVVAPSGGDYTSIQDALDAIGTNGGTIYIAAGTYTITTGLLVKRSRTQIRASQGAIIQCNGANVATLIKPNATGLSQIVIEGGKWLQTNGTAQGIGFDFSDSANCWIRNVRIEEFGTAFKMHDSVSTTFYNSFRDSVLFNCNNGIDIGGTQANANLFDNIRIRPKAGGGGTGVKLVDARGNTFVHCDIEPSTAVGITGVSLDATSRENAFINCWIENNATGVSVTSGATRNSFIGCSITSNTTDISDSGTNTMFLNTSRTGTLVGQMALNVPDGANKVALAITQNDATNDPRAMSIVNASSGPALYIDQNANTGQDDGLSGALVIDMTGATGNGLQVYTNQATPQGSENLVFIKAANAGWNRPLLRVNDVSTAGGAANIRIDSPNPDIEFVETDQVQPAGMFELAVNSDSFQINGRNAANDSFEPIAMFRRTEDGGTMGLGTEYDIPNAMLEIVTNTGFGHLYVSNAVGADSGDIFCVREDGDVGVGAKTPAGKLHVDQSSATGAKPVLYLDQADVSEEILEINSTAGTGNAIEAVGAKTLTTTHFIKVTINGDTRYIPAGTIA
jgi:hypothetical protein